MNYSDYLNPNDEYDPTAGQIMFTRKGEPTCIAELGGVIVTQSIVTLITGVHNHAKVASRVMHVAEDETQERPAVGLLNVPRMGVSNSF